jgi:hypothetical protein
MSLGLRVLLCHGKKWKVLAMPRPCCVGVADRMAEEVTLYRGNCRQLQRCSWCTGVQLVGAVASGEAGAEALTL